MLMDMGLPKFGIYQGTGATSCFKSLINSCCPHSFQEKVLSDVRSEIHLAWRNIISTEQSVWAKNILFRSDAITWLKAIGFPCLLHNIYSTIYSKKFIPGLHGFILNWTVLNFLDFHKKILVKRKSFAKIVLMNKENPERI